VCILCRASGGLATLTKGDTALAQFSLDNYVPVNLRLAHFYTQHSAGRVQTSIVEHDRESGFIIVRAEIYRDTSDTLPASTGHAFEQRSAGHVNKTSYIENCETSAVGRALALLGYGITKAISSREEMEKVQRMSDDTLKVRRRNGYYLVADRFNVTKQDGTVACDCGEPNCSHIQAVRAFASTADMRS
jgi:hypothetical protein